jgi:tetratricopeptide (TPR) repeat protein
MSGSFLDRLRFVMSRISFLVIFYFTVLPLWAFPPEDHSPGTQTDISSDTLIVRISNSGTQMLNKKNTNLQLWLSSERDTLRNIQLKMVGIQGPDNKLLKIGYTVRPESEELLPVAEGLILTIHLDSLAVNHLTPGDYKAFVLLRADQLQPVLKTIPFQIKAQMSFLEGLINVLKWIKNNIPVILWNILEILLLLFLFTFIFRFIFVRLYLLKKKSLKVLPIINETGDDKEYKGIASGIDDILMTRLQNIVEMSQSGELKQYWLPTLESTGEGKSQTLNVVGGEVSLQLQQLGDVSIGPIKIPLGTITSILLKVFGGVYLTGALQKYGRFNKLVLSLENHPSIFEKENLSVQYFEATWPSEIIKEETLQEGVPLAVEELSYQIILNLSKDIGTDNWQAYKFFLMGNTLFNEFEKNRTRLDLLKNAISIWRESVRFDPDFAKTHYNLGVALDMQQKYEDAIFRYQKAIRLSPELIGTEAHYNLAKLYWDIYKDAENTLKELAAAEKLNPNLPDIYNLKGLVQLNKKDYPEAEKYFLEAIQQSTKPNPVYHYNLSVVYYYLNKFEEGQKQGEEAVKLYKDKVLPANLLQTLGWIHVQKAVTALTSTGEQTAKSEYEKAIHYLKEGLKIEPENRDMLDACGRALYGSGDYEDAYYIQKRLLRLWPEYNLGYQEFAKTLSALDKPKNQVKIFQNISQILSNPDNLASVQQITTALQPVETDEQESQVYSAILGSVIYYFFRLGKEAIIHFDLAFLDRSLDVNLSLLPELYHNYALVLKDVGRVNDALTAYEKSWQLYHGSQFYDLAQCHNEYAQVSETLLYKFIKQNPNNKQIEVFYYKTLKEYQNSLQSYKNASLWKMAADIHVARAEVYMEMWHQIKYDTLRYVKDECDKAIQLNNDSADAFHIKGNSFYYQKKYEEAIPQYEKSVELNFNLPGAQYNLGLCYYYQQDYETALSKFEITTKLDEYYSNAYDFMVKSLVKMGRKKEALQVLRKTIQIFPGDANFSIELGKHLKSMGYFEEAIQELKITLVLDKKNKDSICPLILNELADVLAISGADLQQATDYLWEARDICRKRKPETDLKMVRNTLGWICYLRGRYQRAIFLMERTLSAYLNDPLRHARLARAYEAFSEVCEEKDKVHYQKNALEQWKLVYQLSDDEKLKTQAEKKLQ